MIDILEAAHRTGYHPATITRKIKSGVLPATRRGRKFYIDEADLVRLYSPVGE